MWTFRISICIHFWQVFSSVIQHRKKAISFTWYHMWEYRLFLLKLFVQYWRLKRLLHAFVICVVRCFEVRSEFFVEFPSHSTALRVSLFFVTVLQGAKQNCKRSMQRIRCLIKSSHYLLRNNVKCRSSILLRTRVEQTGKSDHAP